MAFLAPSDGVPISPNQQSFGTPSQIKVSGDRQRETTHDICCLAAKCSVFSAFVISTGGPRIVRILGHQGIVLLQKSY